MEKTKVFGIKDKDFFQFIKKINEFNSENNVIATQTHILNNEFYAVIYFNSKTEIKVASDEKIDNELPNEEQPPTKNQIYRLNKLKLPIPKTKKEAWKVLNPYLKKKD